MWPILSEFYAWFFGIPKEALQSLILGVSLLTLASVGSWLVAHRQTLEDQRFWRLTFRNIAAVGFLLGASIIWRGHLQPILVALSATTAGILIAFREAFLSLLAFWLRVVKQHYRLGDFIEIDGIRGEVVDITWQHTMLAETGPGKDALNYSGRVVQVPNHRMLSSPLFVDNLTGEFGAHSIQLPLPEGASALAAEARLLAAASLVCDPYQARAEQHMAQLRRAHAIDTPSVEPRVRIRINEEGQAGLVLRVVVPAREKLRAEQLILREYLRQTEAVVRQKSKRRT